LPWRIQDVRFMGKGPALYACVLVVAAVVVEASRAAGVYFSSVSHSGCGKREAPAAAADGRVVEAVGGGGGYAKELA
jgi:hypothetical protein